MVLTDLHHIAPSGRLPSKLPTTLATSSAYSEKLLGLIEVGKPVVLLTGVIVRTGPRVGPLQVGSLSASALNK